MTAKQLAFAQAILAGKSSSEAFKEVSSSKTLNRASIARQAHEILMHPEVNAYIAKERASAAVAFSWSREEMLGTLKEIVETADVAVDKTRAIAQASKMLGYDAPQKLEVFGVGELLGLVRNKQ